MLVIHCLFNITANGCKKPTNVDKKHESSNFYCLQRDWYKQNYFKRMESRIQILDRLAHKWSRNNPDCIAVETFEEWLLYYDYEATLRLVYIAMQEYAKQSLK